MFETITKHVRENSVVRFLLSHLIILLAALLICAVGFAARSSLCAMMCWTAQCLP